MLKWQSKWKLPRAADMLSSGVAGAVTSWDVREAFTATQGLKAGGSLGQTNLTSKCYQISTSWLQLTAATLRSASNSRSTAEQVDPT
jgi:hypothetical protein